MIRSTDHDETYRMSDTFCVAASRNEYLNEEATYLTVLNAQLEAAGISEFTEAERRDIVKSWAVLPGIRIVLVGDILQTALTRGCRQLQLGKTRSQDSTPSAPNSQHAHSQTGPLENSSNP